MIARRPAKEKSMDCVRTPDERFEDLPGYPFEPHYAEVDGIRMHYVDEGPGDAPVILMLHGEPSWSYLYRKMIPPFAEAGFRAIAPDLVGFGRSDKPVRREDYTYQRHVDWTRGLLFDVLDLRGVTLVCQDWGGLIGLRLVAEHAERFTRVVAANTLLPTGDDPPTAAFEAWRKFSQEVPDFPTGAILNGATQTDLSPEVVAAYDAPFPGATHQAGARQFPLLVPISPDDPAAPANRAAWKQLLAWEKPFLTAFSDGDPITAPAAAGLQRIPGAQGRSHPTIAGAGHFLQEDRGEALARIVLDFVRET
jgi:haloalkane dehalogenase